MLKRNLWVWILNNYELWFWYSEFFLMTDHPSSYSISQIGCSMCKCQMWKSFPINFIQSVNHAQCNWSDCTKTVPRPQSLSAHGECTRGDGIIEHTCCRATFNQIKFSLLHMLQMLLANLPNSFSTISTMQIHCDRSKREWNRYRGWKRERKIAKKNLIEFSLRQFFGPWPTNPQTAFPAPPKSES